MGINSPFTDMLILLNINNSYNIHYAKLYITLRHQGSTVFTVCLVNVLFFITVVPEPVFHCFCLLLKLFLIQLYSIFYSVRRISIVRFVSPHLIPCPAVLCSNSDRLTVTIYEVNASSPYTIIFLLFQRITLWL